MQIKHHIKALHFQTPVHTGWAARQELQQQRDFDRLLAKEPQSNDKAESIGSNVRNIGLALKIADVTANVNATGGKPHYCKLKAPCFDFGYRPELTSLEGACTRPP